MKIETCLNTPDDTLFRNIYQNSRLPLSWVKSLPEHDGHAVLVGGGPSLKKWIDEIQWRQSIGQTVFALNRASLFLYEQGITPEHQVVLDARAHNASLVGGAKHYYFASQCDPALFKSIDPERITLWHQHYPDDLEVFDAQLPDYHDDYSLIGGGTTVGLSAMALAYTLGFRKLHLYGYDSSYDEGTHAYTQHDPQGVDCVVTVGGKSFKTSLAMAQQSDLFPGFCDKLIDAGCLITDRSEGLLRWQSHCSSLKPSPSASEKEKYTKMWQFPAYREVVPGEECLEEFLREAKPSGKIIDFGCGTGKAGLRLHNLGFDVLLVDFVSTSRNDEAHELHFVECDLAESIPVSGDYGYCTDVLEHIPPNQLQDVVTNILESTDKVFFQISTIDDNCGKLIGEPLHLSVHSYGWWDRFFKNLGYMVNYSREAETSVIFYIEKVSTC